LSKGLIGFTSDQAFGVEIADISQGTRCEIRPDAHWVSLLSPIKVLVLTTGQLNVDKQLLLFEAGPCGRPFWLLHQRRLG
jgi:hypothetical protein